jgi:hypothetical protein
MIMAYELLLDIIKLIVEILVIAGIAWLAVPYVFRFFVAPNFNGAYQYNKHDFEQDGITPKKVAFSPQKNNFTFDWDATKHEYLINFGENRDLNSGKIKIHYNGVWYSSKPDTDEKLLVFKQDLQIDSSATKSFNTPSFKGDQHNKTLLWTLDNTEINVITRFVWFTDCQLEIKEPDLVPKTEVLKNLNFIIFELEFPDGLDNCTTGVLNDQIIQFPCLENNSPNIRFLTFINGIFSPPTNKAVSTNGPRVFFDVDFNTFLITAVDDFMPHFNTYSNSVLSAGLEGEIEKVPKGFVSKYLLMFDHGIKNTFERMGEILRAYHDKQRKSMYMDIPDGYLGYWTNNGGYYYYKPIKGLKLSETLVEVKKHTDSIGLPLKYMNLDSWWYIKDVQQWKRKLLGGFGRIVGGGLYGGTIAWEMDPNTMHVSPDELSKVTQTVFVAHNRWFSDKNIYKNQFKFQDENGKSICLDPEFWDLIMSNCKKWNINTYKQDWMNNQVKACKILRDNPTTGNTWLMNMGNAAEKYDIKIQYCMSNPGMFLTSLKLNAVSFARTCGDYNPRWPRCYDYRFFMQTSILAYALRLWPFKDVLRSSCEGPINGEQMPEFMVLISNLSCGPVGSGDRIGKFGVDTLMKTCRNDGLILKPDKSLRATDLMFNPNAKYFISSTYSDNSGFRWHYVLVNKLNMNKAKDPNVFPNDLGISDKEKLISYDYFNQKFHHFDEDCPLFHRLKGQGYIYWILAPFICEGVALIGDISKYVTMSFKEFQAVNCSNKQINVVIDNVKGDVAKLLLYNDNKIDTIKYRDTLIPLIKCSIDSKSEIEDLNTDKIACYLDEASKICIVNIPINEDGTQEVQFIMK